MEIPDPKDYNVTIFVGNGFDLSLGLKSRYLDYFNHKDENGKKDFWPEKFSFTDEDQLYKRLNGDLLTNEEIALPNENITWYDLEDELKKHAKREPPKGIMFLQSYDESSVRDKEYYEKIKEGLKNYLIHAENEWLKDNNTWKKIKGSPAYQLMYEICVKAKADPYVITFNYTNIHALLDKAIDNSWEKINIRNDRVQFVHGSLLEDHIILGINEDKDVPKEYDFLFKSWDVHYVSHQVIDTLKNSQVIFFFGISFGSIDSVYFIDFFESIINGKYDNNKKHLVICTFNEKSMREIYRQFFQMGISLMELKAHCDFKVLLTNPEDIHNPLKFERGKISQWMSDWDIRDISITPL